MSIRIKGDRALKTPSGLLTRPTPSKVRSAVFNILQGRIYGASWLDICAGSGAMGAEALVRGAEQVVGLEISAIACRIIRSNWQTVAKPSQKLQVFKGDAVKLLPKLGTGGFAHAFDLVYFDPPYQSSLYQPVLEALPPLLRDDGLVIAESDRALPLPDRLGELVCCDRRQYGQTALTFYQQV
ncbi:MAG: 16S rRNA (guanine(966)-N(2))-methyltransferase RsmD [Pseudanabaenaceae cyanobacterium bins.39]|nr:16S rRNA (guanine(966)-N(2))-methyltransferase RsmD [Pseudanabaenaceae cyanobacterium bins.39]